MPDHDAGVVAAMLEPGFYPHDPATVELRETHTSWVFLAGDLAYKVKKPVVLPFLDYGTPERRLEMCREEVRLNRRLAPDYYLGVDAIVRTDAGLSLAPVQDQGAIEYAVRMKRVPEERTLASLIERGAVAGDDVDAVARLLAGFHATAAQAPAEFRELGPLAESLRENVATLEAEGGDVLPAPRLRAARAFTEAFLGGGRELLERRAAAGRTRDCHGDLRAEHVIVDDPVAVYDCVEFNPALRFIDVAADLAFLVMDCARLQRGDLAEDLELRYRESGGDPGPPSLLAFYASYRAWVRAKVACVRAAELGADASGREDSAREARELLALGHRFAWRARMPIVVVVCGPSGSGKTTLAARLSEVSGLIRHGSDETRKRLAGLAPDERAPERYYSAEFNRRTYSELGCLAAAELERSGGVIVDATFRHRGDRDAFRDGLGRPDAPVLFAGCVAPPQVLRQRTRVRAGRPHEVSDAGPEVVERQLAQVEPFDEVDPAMRVELRGDGPLDDAVVALESAANRVAWPRG